MDLFENIINPSIKITTKDNCDVNSVAKFESRLTEKETKISEWSVNNFKYINSYYVGLDNDSTTLYISVYYDAQAFKYKLDKEIYTFAAVTSIDNPDQLAIFTLDYEHLNSVRINLIRCDYIPTGNIKNDKFECVKDKFSSNITTNDYMPMTGGYKDQIFFEILDYRANEKSFVVLLQRDRYAIRLVQYKNWERHNYILVSNIDLTQISNFEINAYDILIDVDNDYVLIISSHTKIIRINISKHFVWESTNSADFIEVDLSCPVLIRFFSKLPDFHN